MTEEQTTKLIELVESYNLIERYSMVISLILMIMLVGTIIYATYVYQKIKKMHNEWKSTLTEEEIKAINRSKEYWK